ncbi:MAG: HD domain-containing protein, partial [Pseudomonadota bacterium]|nr:HD domain-containing protein [Pseudomonadota bacterium]
ASASGWRTTVQTFARDNFKNPAWGYSHSVRDYRLAVKLSAADQVRLDDDVLFAVAFLHDIAAFPPWENDKLDHSDVGADVVESILRNTGFPTAKIDAVREAIRTHMYYRDPQSPEARYIHDADALDWLGAIGAARVVALVDPTGGSEDLPAAVTQLEEYLAKVPGRVISPAGRAQVAPRKAELENLLADLRRESGNLTDL